MTRVLAGGRADPVRRMTIAWLWEPRDVWVGIYWNQVSDVLFIYIGFLPCLPIAIAIRRSNAAT